MTALGMTALGIMMASSPAYAETTEELLAIVRAQSAEITALKARVEALEKPAAAAAAGTPAPAAAQTATAAPATPAPEAEDRIAWKGAPVITSADGNFSFKPRGRINVDAWGVNSRTDGVDYGSGTEVRRGRLGAEGTIYRDIQYMIEVDFAGEGVSYQDVTLAYAISKPFKITVGYHKSPITLEDQTSDTYVTFIERANYATAFAPGRGVGISASYSGSRGMIEGGIFGEGENDSRDGKVDEDWILSARASFAPWVSKNGAAHLGLSAYYLNAGQDTPGFRTRERPEVHLSTQLVDTGPLIIDSAKFIGLEAAIVQGPVHASAEWGWQKITRPGQQNATFDGGYAEIGWFLTGETRPYSAAKGSFTRLKPKNNFMDGGIGAFEVAGRFSTLDLEDGGIMGGVEKNWTLGLNWYANPYVRLMFNWVHFNVERNFATLPNGSPDNKGDAFGMRAQIDW